MKTITFLTPGRWLSSYLFTL